MGKTVYFSDDQLEYIKTVFEQIGFQEEDDGSETISKQEVLRMEVIDKVSK